MKKLSIIFLNLFFIPMCLFSEQKHGKIYKELMDFYHRCGAVANKSSPEIYNGQRGGYATGGSLVVKNRSQNIQPFTISLPNIDAGCGGIDIYTGGLSYINSQDLVETLKSIGSNSASYAFLLALQSVSPQIASTIVQLQSFANHVNSQNINSCEAAMKIVDSIALKLDAARQQQCRSYSLEEGINTGYTGARNECADPENDADNIHKESNALNIAWEAIQKHPDLSKDKEVAEFFMNITGTLIYDGEKVQYIPSKVFDDDFLRNILEGGTIKLHACKGPKDKCLVTTEITKTIDAPKSWVGDINRILNKIVWRYLHEDESEGLAQEELELLSKSKLPLCRILSVLASYQKRESPFGVYDVAEMVARDLMMYYLEEIITLIREGCVTLKHQVFCDAEIEEFLNQLSTLQAKVEYEDLRSVARLQKQFTLLRQVDMMEEQLWKEIML